ncbi:hypothetical protein ACFLU4_05030 [Chloroflexota bacterium]
MKRLISLRRLLEDAEERGINPERVMANPNDVAIVDDADETFDAEE